MLKSAFADKHTFYLPDTLNLAGRISAFQGLRFHRTRFKNLLVRCGAVRLSTVFNRINLRATNGDLIVGGHIDFTTVRKHIRKNLAIVTIFRDPVTRCVSEYNYARHSYFKKDILTRFDSKILAKMAGKYSFRGYLDFLFEHAPVYGNLATTYVGWNGVEKLDSFFSRQIFHSGVLEEGDKFASGLSAKIGKKVLFPHENRLGEEREIAISKLDQQRIEQIYNKDMELYAWQLRNI